MRTPTTGAFRYAHAFDGGHRDGHFVRGRCLCKAALPDAIRLPGQPAADSQRGLE